MYSMLLKTLTLIFMVSSIRLQLVLAIPTAIIANTIRVVAELVDRDFERGKVTRPSSASKTSSNSQVSHRMTIDVERPLIVVRTQDK